MNKKISSMILFYHIGLIKQNITVYIEGHPTAHFSKSCKINLKQHNDNEEPQNNCF